MDLVAAVNAYGLYNLYAGCDGDENRSYGVTVLPGDFTYYAILGHHFMRIDIEAGEGIADGKKIVDDFSSKERVNLAASEPLPLVVER